MESNKRATLALALMLGTSAATAQTGFDFEEKYTDEVRALHLTVKRAITNFRGDWNRVLVMARRALTLEPQCPPGRLFLAEALYHTGRRDQAAKELQNAVRDRHPEVMPTHPQYVRLIRELNRPRYEELRRLISGTYILVAGRYFVNFVERGVARFARDLKICKQIFKFNHCEARVT